MAKKPSGKDSAAKGAGSKKSQPKKSSSKNALSKTAKKSSSKRSPKKHSQSSQRADQKPPSRPAQDDSTYPEGESPSIRRVMMPRDTNAVGTIFGGTILAEIDLAAATEAHKHHAGMVVTVSMEKIDFVAPVYVGDLVSFFTKTVRVGRSSICVQVSVWAQRRFGGGQQAHVTEAQVTMVAVDTNFRPIAVGTIPS